MNITHLTEQHRFETVVDDVTAYLSYVPVDANTLNYNHTIVPSALGGRGIGSQLVKHALDYAQAHNKKIIPSCSFVASYIQKNPHYQSLIA